MIDEHISGVCLVIAIILSGLTIGFIRAKRLNWALAVLPLGIVPLVTGVGMLIAEYIIHSDHTFILPMVLVMSSLVVSSIWIGFASGTLNLIKTKKLRAYYIALSVAFVFTLSIIILIKYYRYFEALAAVQQ